MLHSPWPLEQIQFGSSQGQPEAFLLQQFRGALLVEADRRGVPPRRLPFGPDGPGLSRGVDHRLQQAAPDAEATNRQSR